MSKTASEDDDEALLHAMMESAAMDETRDYLMRGRPYADLSDQALRDEWTKAFKGWFASRDRAEQRNTDDFSAELRLRKLEPPFERIMAESETMAEEIRRQGAHSPGVREKIEKFRGDLRERKN